ncbi:MAG: TRAP transporter large permease subunit, partial [Tateyamaria sp.]|nr:TRAP transporter large permease subunit [Tateyamaria sp.]
TAVVCIVMGMGLPTVGVYLLLASLAAPPLIELGLNPMAAHLFVLYFGMLSMLTPPVAIAAFVAANLAKADAMRTALEAVRIGWPAYLIPFIFIATPELLFNGSFTSIIVMFVKSLIGVAVITSGIVGFWKVELKSFERFLLMISGVVVLLPLSLADEIAWLIFGAVLIMFGIFWRSAKRVS